MSQFVVDMAKRPTGPGRTALSHRLLDGRHIGLRGLTSGQRAFLADLKKVARADISYFEIERMALGPGSVALAGRNRVDERLAETPTYLVAEDIATRAGIEQGLVLAPQHKMPAPASLKGQMLSVVQAADTIGISRTAVYKALARGALRGVRVGNVTVVDRASVVAYRDQRDAVTARAVA